MTDHRERRRFLANAARLVVASLLGGPLSTLGRSPIAAQAAGAAAPILAVGGGAFATEAVLLRGCSALSTGVAGVGGALPRGLSVDFRRSIACLISGVDRHTIEVRSTDSVLSAAPGADWAVIGIAREVARRSWRARIGQVVRPVGRETASR